MAFLRHPWFARAVLAIYLTANVGVRGLHHHVNEARTLLASVASQANSHLNAPFSPPAECDDHPCPICNVLYLAQFLPALAVATLVGHTGEALTPAVVSVFHPVASAIHSRAPPAV